MLNVELCLDIIFLVTTVENGGDASSSRRCEYGTGTSCPLSKALTMPCRDEMSKRISLAFAVTERKVNRTLREKYLAVRDQRKT